MADDQLQQAEQPTAAQEGAAKAGAGVTLDSAINALARYGGFTFLETAIDGIQNLNPDRKARKNMFLQDSQKKGER